MPSPTRTIETDMCVVGAGLIGLAHALEARRRGLSVVLMDRGARAAGASVRGSGHLFFSALESGPALEAAPLARERWIEVARRAGMAVDRGGTLIIARNRDEMAALEAAAAEPGRRARMRSAKKVGQMAPIPVEKILGGFHATADLRIGPRSAPAALTRLLDRDPCARVERYAHVHQIEPGVIHAGPLRVRAAAIVVCPGADYRMLPVELRPERAAPRLRETQMLRLAAPSGRRYRQTLVSGLGLIEHPGFSVQQHGRKLRERFELETPELVERGVSLAVTQLANGDLVLGSTSTYTELPSTYSRERRDDLLLGQAGRLLGVEPRVKQRWSAVHAAAGESDGDFLTTEPMTGMRLVLAMRPTAAALCHAHAQTVLDDLSRGAGSSAMYITVRDMRRGAKPSGGVHDHADAFTRTRPVTD